MKKSLLLFAALLPLAAPLTAYDFRNMVFGNQIKEITDKSEIKNLRNELEPSIEYYNSENGYYTQHGGMNALDLIFYKIYKEPYENGTIYRMLRYDYDGLFRSFAEDGYEHDYTFDNHHYYSFDGLYQFVFLKVGTAVKCLGVYEIHYYYIGGGYAADGETHIYKNFAVISRESNIKAFLLTTTTDSRTDYFREKRIETVKKSEGVWLYFDDDFVTRFPKSMDFEKCKQDAVIIEASFPLIDKARPFMYTLQNAFDGDSATSFVEDTEDNLLEIKITQWPYKVPFQCKSLRIINGYASGEKLYRSNNRIREIKSERGDSFTCKDDTRSYQMSDWHSPQLIVKSVYKGDKYSDTCLAELDFMLENGNWLFGE